MPHAGRRRCSHITAKRAKDASAAAAKPAWGKASADVTKKATEAVAAAFTPKPKGASLLATTNATIVAPAASVPTSSINTK